MAGVYMFNVSPNMIYHGPIFALLTVNALIARFTDTTTIYVVPTPSKPAKDKGGEKAGSGDALKKD